MTSWTRGGRSRDRDLHSWAFRWCTWCFTCLLVCVSSLWQIRTTGLADLDGWQTVWGEWETMGCDLIQWMRSPSWGGVLLYILILFQGCSLVVLYTFHNSIGSLIGEVFRCLETGNIELLEADRNDGFARGWQEDAQELRQGFVFF